LCFSRTQAGLFHSLATPDSCPAAYESSKKSSHSAWSGLWGGGHRPVPLGVDLLVRRDNAFIIEAEYGVWLRPIARHSWRSVRHTGYSEASELGIFLEKSENDITRHMALDDVFTDSASVARG
jgi:hypothetical protein